MSSTSSECVEYANPKNSSRRIKRGCQKFNGNIASVLALMINFKQYSIIPLYDSY